MTSTEQIQRDQGLPQALHTNNGLELLGKVFVQWAKTHGMILGYIQSGKPNQNAYIELFNHTFRDELLGQHLLLRLDDDREAIHR